MTTWNTTFNYNQPSFKMNFGEAMLYSAFGQLTGGIGGGCFGGYGMGSYGMSGFGMGGSLFSMMGMGGYGCGMSSYMYDDSYAGAQVGFMGVNIALQGIGGYLQERKAEKAKVVSPEQLVKNLEDSIKALKDKNTDEAVAKTIDKSFQTNIDNAKARQLALPGEIVEKQNLIDTAKKAEKPDTANIAKLEAQLTELQNEQIKVDGDASVEGSVKFYEKAKDDAIKAIQKKNQVEIDRLNKELEKAEQQKEKQEQVELLNQYDSTSLNRASKKTLEKFDGNQPSTDKATRAEITGALAAYKNAEKQNNKADMNKYERILKQIALNNKGDAEIKDFAPAFKSLGISLE